MAAPVAKEKGGRRRLIDQYRWEQVDALHRLCDRLGRPVHRHELATELNVAPAEVTPRVLVQKGFALSRTYEKQIALVVRP